MMTGLRTTWTLGALLCTGVATAGGTEPALLRFPVPQLKLEALGAGPATLQQVPASSDPIMGDFPAFVQVRYGLPGPVRAGGPQAITVSVYAVPSLKQLSGASSRRDDILRQVTTLQQINAGTLNPASLAGVSGSQALGRPQLPFMYNPFVWQWSAGQVQRLTLPGGLRGVRYLVVRVGDGGFVHPDMTEYVFQGLTADGQFYVSFTAPFDPVGIASAAERQRQAAGRSGAEEAQIDADAESVRQGLERQLAVRLAPLDRVLRSLQLR